MGRRHTPAVRASCSPCRLLPSVWRRRRFVWRLPPSVGRRSQPCGGAFAPKTVGVRRVKGGGEDEEGHGERCQFLGGPCTAARGAFQPTRGASTPPPAP